jgi:hypothetical protein
MRVWELLLQSVNCHWSLVIGYLSLVIGHGLLLLYLPHSLRPLSFGTDKYKKNIPLFTVNSQQSTVNNQQSAVNNQQSTINNFKRLFLFLGVPLYLLHVFADGVKTFRKTGAFIVVSAS